MKIAYIAHTRFPTEKAHGHQMAQVCSAMAELGHEVTLLHPHVWNSITKPGCEYYGLPDSFEHIELPSFDALGTWYVPNKVSMLVSMHSYKKRIRQHFSVTQYDLVYVRSPLLLSCVLSLGVPVILELHSIPRRFQDRFVDHCNQVTRIVALTGPMRDELVCMGVDAERIVVEGDGVRLSNFATMISKEKAVLDWSLPEGVPIIGYTGSLTTQTVIEKGIEQMIAAFAELTKREVEYFGWIVGGNPSDIERFSRLAKEQYNLGPERIRFEGRIGLSRIPSALSACDVTLYPAPKLDHPYFLRDTSPLKLFEYLASGKPIACADIPPIRDVVDEDIVHFSEPGSGSLFADAIENALCDTSEEAVLHRQEKAKSFDWTKRMERILQPLI